MTKLNDKVNELKTKKPETRVAIIVDRSASMKNLSKFVVDTYNEQLAELRKNIKEQDITISLVFFDSDVEVKCFNEPLDIANDLSYDEYQTGSMTALNDAVGLTISNFKNLKDHNDENVSHLVVIITDGYENASKEFTQSLISSEIETLQEENWTFSYLGANVDVKKVAATYSIPVGNTMNYCASMDGLKMASTATTGSLSNYMSLRSTGVRTVKNFYSE